MGATSTMRVSRRDALAAMAELENGHLSDEAVEERLNALIAQAGYSLDEVSIVSSSDDWDAQNLERIVRSRAP